jgi:antitoxin (DNA-binding transcriptional repressor) of toxin-antitoxin stability system
VIALTATSKSDNITRRGKPVATLVGTEDLEITLTPREKPPRDADRLALIRAVGDLKVHQGRGKPQGARVRLEAAVMVAPVAKHGRCQT